MKEVGGLDYDLCDGRGRSVEVRFVEGGMVVIDNRIGVVRNKGDLNWDYENLKEYMHVRGYKIDNRF
ncbi:linear amide C-N hydrolase [Staphylococcus hominis]|uniref:linear amide C-N hydrolase n=1 Tax=Staphylococcus hominis TaxID=1290 RepID=UPI0021B636C5|nr:linear amide C-N hydrolase [Staphylococcus hominis]